MGLGFSILIGMNFVDQNSRLDHAPEELLSGSVLRGTIEESDSRSGGPVSLNNASRIAGNATFQQAISATAIALAIILLVLIWMKKAVISPITEITQLVLSARGGKVEARPDDQLAQRKDEIGVLAKEFSAMLGEIQRAQEEIISLSAAQVQERTDQLDAALNNMSQGLCMFDRDHRLVVCNAQFAKLYALPDHLRQSGTSLRDILAHRVQAGNAVAPSESYVEREMEGARRGEPFYAVGQLQDGRTIAGQSQPMPGGGWVSTHEDITERKNIEEQIAYLAHHDGLTDLPNRVLLQNELEQQLARVKRGDSMAVLCLDLDHFKAVNDTLGHPIGDALLKEVGRRLSDCVRAEDTVARLGGDEFAIIQVAGEQPVGATTLARRIIEVISRPFNLDGHQVMIGTSIGIAVAPADGNDPDRILKNADMALYRAKADGRAAYRFFEPEMDSKMQARRTLEIDLRRALSQAEFELYYQPLVNLQEERVSAFEALIRWNHPTRGQIPPTEFIPLAEEIGLIVSIGKWVLHKACAEASAWPTTVRISVNLSPAQFKTTGLVSNVKSALEDSGLDPTRLELEITESVLLHNSEETLSVLHELRALGVSISMDDFGTGYSSLSYLRSFPFDKIKIDQSFIRDIDLSHEATAIIRAVSGLGFSLGMATTAEGVETAEQLASLRNEGCTEVQGYYFSPPRPAREVAGLIASIDGMRVKPFGISMDPATDNSAETSPSQSTQVAA
jgi:diguanylate cyclase (GGDEF)-like protein